jgi:hypothetical protein
MKKNIYVFCGILLLFLACKHESVIPDSEYFNQAAIDKIATYSKGYSLTNDGSFSIISSKDSTGNNQFLVNYHISYNHTLDAIQVDKSVWSKLPEHFGYHFVTTSLSSDKNQMVAFKIRSKTPQDEVINGEILVPKQTPITATDLGNNMFKITWEGQNRNDRILISIKPYFVYEIPFYQGNFVVETEDDGEYILQPSVIEKFEKNTSNWNTLDSPKQKMQINLMRNIPNTRVNIKQLSTGKDYDVYGGYSEMTRIEAIKIQ